MCSAGRFVLLTPEDQIKKLKSGDEMRLDTFTNVRKMLEISRNNLEFGASSLVIDLLLGTLILYVKGHEIKILI